MSERYDKLLLSIASDFERGAVPMNETWLAENNVTLDECCALGDKLSIIIAGFVRASLPTQTAIMLHATLDDSALADHLANVVKRDAAFGKAVAGIVTPRRKKA